MLPDAAARATERYFRELPRVVHRVCDEWGSKTSNILRRLTVIPKEVRKTIYGRAIRYGGESFAQVTCESQIGLFIERGTGIYGPFKKPIHAKGGPFIDALGRKRERRLLRWKGTVWSDSRGGVTGRAGYIYALEVKGSPASPWFVPHIEDRIPIFERCLRLNMLAATDAIRAGAPPMRGIIPCG